MNLSLLTVLCHDKNNSQLKELLKNNKILDFINTFIKDKPYYESIIKYHDNKEFNNNWVELGWNYDN